VTVDRATRGICWLKLLDFQQLAFNPHRISCSLLSMRARDNAGCAASNLRENAALIASADDSLASLINRSTSRCVTLDAIEGDLANGEKGGEGNGASALQDGAIE